MARTVQLSAILDEKTNFDTLIGDGDVRLEASLVRRVNSAGIRGWIRKLEQLRKSGAKVLLSNASPIVVRYVNEMPGFCHSSSVESLQLPYLCPKCGAEQYRTVKLEEARALSAGPPAIVCSCGAQADFDDVPEDYFAFLKR